MSFFRKFIIYVVLNELAEGNIEGTIKFDEVIIPSNECFNVFIGISVYH